jgi:galactokinase
VLVLDSGIERALAGSGFNQRRQECEEAAAQLGVKSLRDVDTVAAVDALAEPWRRRARHVVTENARVLRAVQGVSAAAFGELMNASHASLRDDYEVSVPALDTLVALLQRQPGVFGARLTGAGFGGACVALCAAALVGEVADDVLAAYARAGEKGRVLSPPDFTPAGHSPPA